MDEAMEGVIAVDDPRAQDVRALLAAHLAFANQHSPPEDVHALDIDGLIDPAVTFFSYRVAGRLLAIGALRRIDAEHAEVKSMHTASSARGRGIGRAMLAHLIAEARVRGYRRLSLETGTMAAFVPARSLYAAAGFVPCEPFGRYLRGPNSTCMTLELTEPAGPPQAPMAMPLSLLPNNTHHQLLAASGKRWAEVILAEDPRQLDMTVFADEPHQGIPPAAHVTAYRHLGRYQGRQQVLIGAGVVGGWFEEWRMPERAAEGRFALKSMSGVTCGCIHWSADRERVEILDTDGNLRVVLSVDEQPACAGERFRGTIRTPDGPGTMLHVLLIDGSLPAGETTVAPPRVID